MNSGVNARVAVVVSVGAMVAGLLAGGAAAATPPVTVVAPRGVAAAIPPVVAANSIPALSEQVSEWSGASSDIVFLAPLGDELALAQAAANASLYGAFALMARSADGLDVLSQLADVGPSSIKLVGSPDSFSAPFIGRLQSQYTVDTTLVAASTFGRSSAAADSSARTRIVITDRLEEDVRAVAATLAITTGSALVILDGQEDVPAVAAVLEDAGNAQITIVGPTAMVSPYQSVGQAVGNRTLWLDTSDPAGAEQLAMQAMVAAGRDAPSVVAATETGLAVRALAGLAARSGDALTGTQAAVTAYVQRLYSPLSAVVVVGQTATLEKAAAISAGAPTSPAAPSFRIVDVVPSAAGYTLTTTAVAGATDYTAYDYEGSAVGASATPSIAVGGAPTPLAVVASSATGQLGQVQMRINDYSTAANREQVVVGSVGEEGNNHLTFLGGDGLPRLVTRMPVSIIAGEVPDPATDTQIAGVTCEGSFTDTVLDPTFQYDYRVTTLSNDRETCGKVPSSAPSQSPVVGGVVFPPTEFPMFMAAETSVRGAGSDGPRASRSVAERMMTEKAAAEGVAPSGPEDRMAASAIGDDWPDMIFRYQGWIRSSAVPGLPPSGRISRPFTFFHGDGRGPDPKGSHRFRQEVRVQLGGDHNLLYSEHMGETIKFACRWPNGSDCEEVSRATAPASQLSLVDTFHSNIYGWFTFYVDATNPLQPGAPAISSDMAVIYGPGGTSIIGWHDKMPSHEIWYYADGWGEWQNAYATQEVGLQCLVGYLPGCTAFVNIRL